MASGDSQRAWFPEMMSELKNTWSHQMTWEECADLCHKMTLFRKLIWKERNIKPARTWCKNCQEYHDSRPPDISIRSMLFALKKIDLHQDAFSLKVSHKRLKKCKYVTDVPLFLGESHGN